MSGNRCSDECRATQPDPHHTLGVWSHVRSAHEPMELAGCERLAEPYLFVPIGPRRHAPIAEEDVWKLCLAEEHDDPTGGRRSYDAHDDDSDVGAHGIGQLSEFAPLPHLGFESVHAVGVAHQCAGVLPGEVIIEGKPCTAGVVTS